MKALVIVGFVVVVGCQSRPQYDSVTTNLATMPKHIRDLLEQDGSGPGPYFVSDDYKFLAWGWPEGMPSLFNGRPYHQVFQNRPHNFFTNIISSQ